MHHIEKSTRNGEEDEDSDDDLDRLTPSVSEARFEHCSAVGEWLVNNV